MPPRARASSAAAPDNKPKPVKATGKMARFLEARKNNNDLLADCERLLLREAEDEQIQNGAPRSAAVIHPSEIAKADWCPRSTFLRIRQARAGVHVEVEANRFQLENIFEEGHEYHRKWQDRFWRMGRLFGRFHCTACTHTWWAISPQECPECCSGKDALKYYEVPLRSSDKYLISGHADGIVVSLAADGEDVFIEIKSVGEGTVRMELPKVLGKHTHEIADEWGRAKKTIDMRGVWKDITKPFGPHLRQGWIYLRLWNEMLPELAVASGGDLVGPLKSITFVYEFKPTSAVKAFVVERNDEAVQDIWDLCADIVYALDNGKEGPACRDRSGPCKECQAMGEKRDDDGAEKAAGRPRRGAGRAGRAGEGGSPAAEEAQAGPARPRRGGPDGPRGRQPDRVARDPDAVGRLLGRPARPR